MYKCEHTRKGMSVKEKKPDNRPEMRERERGGGCRNERKGVPNRALGSFSSVRGTGERIPIARTFTGSARACEASANSFRSISAKDNQGVPSFSRLPFAPVSSAGSHYQLDGRGASPPPS